MSNNRELLHIKLKCIYSFCILLIAYYVAIRILYNSNSTMCYKQQLFLLMKTRWNI